MSCSVHRVSCQELAGTTTREQLSLLQVSWRLRILSRMVARYRGRRTSLTVLSILPYAFWDSEFANFPDMLGDFRICNPFPLLGELSGRNQIYKVERLIETQRFRMFPQSDCLMMLHGTPSRNVFSIIRHGLQPGRESAVWVSNCLPTALTYSTKFDHCIDIFFFIVEVYVGKNVPYAFNEDRGSIGQYNNELLILKFYNTDLMRLRYLVRWRRHSPWPI